MTMSKYSNLGGTLNLDPKISLLMGCMAHMIILKRLSVQLSHIFNRTSIPMPTVCKIVHQRKDSHRPVDKNAPVHPVCSRVLGLWEEAQYEEGNKTHFCHHVDGKAVSAQTELRWKQRCTGQAAPEHATDTRDISRE